MKTITSLEPLTLSQGNKYIADFLGYEYIASNNPNRDPLVLRGHTINHGYWRRSVRDLKDLHTAANEGFQLVIHAPKLTFDQRWEDVMRVILRNS
jgi:hypothetical protein